MVGYEKDESLTPNQKLIAGCISGVLTRFCTQPLDIIKLRTQLQKRAAARDKRFFKTTRAILKEEGLTAFWHGHNLGQMHSVLAFSTQFYMYELSTKFVTNYINPDRKKLWNFLCGIFSGCCSATLVIPLEVIRVRQMLVKAQYGGVLQGAKLVYSAGGILAFYEGLGASLLQVGPQVGISFAVFTYTQPLLLDYLYQWRCSGEECAHKRRHKHDKPEYLLLASTMAGSIAGFVSKTCTYPFDLAKRRLQISSHRDDPSVKAPSTSQNLVRCYNLLGCLKTTLRKEGLPGLYRGWLITVYKAQVTSIVAFSSYELLCYGLREHHRGSTS